MSGSLVERGFGGGVRCEAVFHCAETCHGAGVAGHEDDAADGDVGLEESLGADDGADGVGVEVEGEGGEGEFCCSVWVVQYAGVEDYVVDFEVWGVCELVHECLFHTSSGLYEATSKGLDRLRTFMLSSLATSQLRTVHRSFRSGQNVDVSPLTVAITLSPRASSCSTNS